MAEKTPMVFISHAHEDAKEAKKIHNDLASSGVNAWLDQESILPGRDWKVAISQAIRNCRYFLALLSQNSVNKRGYVQRELSEALNILDEFPSSEIYIIPVRLDECEPSHARLNDLQWTDMFPNWEDGIRKIVSSIRAGVHDELKIKVSASDIDAETKKQLELKKARKIDRLHKEMNDLIGPLYSRLSDKFYFNSLSLIADRDLPDYQNPELFYAAHQFWRDIKKNIYLTPKTTPDEIKNFMELKLGERDLTGQISTYNDWKHKITEAVEERYKEISNDLEELEKDTWNVSAIQIQVKCISKSDRNNPHERILSIGGTNPDGARWKLSQQEAIAGIENGKWKFYVNVGGEVGLGHYCLERSGS
jgi:hypothetical protein